VAVDKEEPEAATYLNTDRGRRKLFGQLKGLKEKHGSKRIVVAYEASTHGFCLYDDCREAGIECFVLAPTKMRKSRGERSSKDDDKDALLIVETLRGHILAGNKLPSIWIPDDETCADRQTVRARLDLGQKLTGVKTQVQTLLKTSRIKKPKKAGNAWSKPYRGWLPSLCMEEENWPALATLLRQIEALEREIAILDKQIKELSETPRYRDAARALVEEVKGAGLLTSMVFLTEMGDMSRFVNRRKIGAFLGLAPSRHESGETDERKGHITREGSWRLRKVLCQGSWARVRSDPGEAAAYERIVRRNPKHKKIAVVAIMRRMGIRMWHVALEAQQKAGVFAACDSHSSQRTA
jgi:transposase